VFERVFGRMFERVFEWTFPSWSEHDVTRQRGRILGTHEKRKTNKLNGFSL